MAATAPAGAPTLSTPDTHIFEEPAPQADAKSRPNLSGEQLYLTYEIKRTADEIRTGKWKRIALQFHDHMLQDAPRVFQALARGLKASRVLHGTAEETKSIDVTREVHTEALEMNMQNARLSDLSRDDGEQLYILADSSYGACCVDEVAAEHAEADVVVHYGRSCLSPTSRLPVIYVFTKPPLELSPVVETFKATFPDLQENIILAADIPYCDYVALLSKALVEEGYTSIFATSVIHDVASPIPNRTVPDQVANAAESLQEYQLFHLSDPPPSLLLILSSRVAAIHIYPTLSSSQAHPTKPLLANSAMTLRRRYALVTGVSSAPIIGILINTLSVKNYMSILAHIKSIIAAAGKKSYTFVVGKVNAAKVANFSEVGGWVVIGCWESSLFESKDFWKPVVTPFELEMALKGDAERIWTGKWTSDFEEVLKGAGDSTVTEVSRAAVEGMIQHEDRGSDGTSDRATIDDHESEDESTPPEFDLRTGRYVSHTRPMGSRHLSSVTVEARNGDGGSAASQTLIKRSQGDVATIGGAVSPAADFFKGKRSWQGLGSDFAVEYDEQGRLKGAEAASVERGRSGIARGYVVGDEKERT